MSFFDRFFGNDLPDEVIPDIKFGRYSDAYKRSAQYEAWDRALSLFDKEQYIESYKIFFDFLRDENENNVRYWEDGGGLKFEILQGSKRLEGYANDAKVRVGAKVAHANDLN
ncbi:MAG: hypothetical protein AAFO94_12315, partial [Bacteroidota bacterium]